MLGELKIRVVDKDQITIDFDGEFCRILGSLGGSTRFAQILPPEMDMPITITTQVPMSKKMITWQNGFVISPKTLVLESPKEITHEQEAEQK